MCKKTAIVVGLNIGSVYVEQLKQRNFKVITVDANPEKHADFVSIQECIKNYNITDNTYYYTIGVICTPNYLHLEHIDLLAPYCEAILVEKPGLENENIWNSTVEKYRAQYHCTIQLVKNNLFRPEVNWLCDFIHNFKDTISNIEINWLTVDRTPFPGGWFTNKKLSWGGISRDILPHLLSFYHGIGGNFEAPIKQVEATIWKFEQTLNTSYGTYNKVNPVYDVDDAASLEFTLFDTLPTKLIAAWKTSKDADDLSINIHMNDGQSFKYEFGLCPNYVYGLMLDAIDNDIDHEKIDTWIHKIISSINK